MEVSSSERIYSLLRQLPRGRVTTYGALAREAGINSARAVGQIVHRNPDPDGTPCYKVVFADGRLAEKYGCGGADAQRRRLEADGVVVRDNHVDLSTYHWDFR